MKNFRLLILALVCVTILPTAMAQVQPQPNAPQPGTPGTPQVLSDPSMTQRLNTDLSNRNSQLGNQSVNWFDYGNKNGYYGTYNVGQDAYMSTYDAQGNYVQTLKQGDWNNPDVPPSLKSAIEQSPYKNQTVTGYWEVSDPDRQGYYLELQDTVGRSSRVWSDQNGKLSPNPPSSPTKTP